MIAMMSLMRYIKQYCDPIEAYSIYESYKFLIKVNLTIKCNLYIMQETIRITKHLIEDDPNDVLRLKPREKY